MRFLLTTILIITMIASVTFAGEIEGRILVCTGQDCNDERNYKAVGKDEAKVQIKCNVNTEPSVTDKFGLYRVYVPSNGGKCSKIIIVYKNESIEDQLAFDPKTSRTFDCKLYREQGMWRIRRTF